VSKPGYGQLLNLVVDRQLEVSDKAWRLYCYLLRCYCQKTGQCNPSATTCARAIGVTERHLYKLRAELAQKKWVRFDYGAAEFLIGANPVQLDRVEDSTPVPPDRPPCPTGHKTLSSRTVACKEEQDEEQNELNKTSVGADAPPAQPTLDSNSFADTGQSTVKAKSAGVKAKKPKAPRQPADVPPAIEFISTLGKKKLYPPEELWPRIVQALSGQVDGDRLQDCYLTWIQRGYSRINYDWLLDWYVNGHIPQRGNSNGKSHTRKTAGDNITDTFNRWFGADSPIR
jgi:hypothetical protein